MNSNFNLWTRFSLNLLFLLAGTAQILSAQGTVNFSGQWLYEKAKSDSQGVEASYPGTILRTIEQTPDSFIYEDLYQQPGSPDWNTQKEKFCLDGKSSTEKTSYSTITRSVRWSADHKTLTTVYLTTQKVKDKNQDFLQEDSYSLSEDGKILTKEHYSKNPIQGEKRGQVVYVKK